MSLCMLYSMGSSYVIIGVRGVITLGGITSNGNLGGVTVTGTLVGVMVGTSLGTTVFWTVSGCMVLNSFSNISMACNWLSPIVKGVCATGFLITCISSLAFLVVCSIADNLGMTRCCGKNYTTSTCFYLLVLGV